MRTQLFISSIAALTPQKTFCSDQWQEDIEMYDQLQLKIIDGDYRSYINPVAVRRMSRIIKMGISAGMQALKDADIETPGAIITATGRGSMSDTETFLKDVTQVNEGTLNPTPFIQSTYNSINGWLALMTKANGYNQTYVHRSGGLYSCLLDAAMLFQEKSVSNCLVGTFDELTHDYFILKKHIDFWKKEEISNLALYRNYSIGTIAGEGVIFLTLKNVYQNDSQSCISLIEQIPYSEFDQVRLNDVLQSNNLHLSDFDAIICGDDGDSRHLHLYEFLNNHDKNLEILRFKHLIGEYDTADTFALFIAHKIIINQTIPNVWNKSSRSIYNKVLIINHYCTESVTVIVVTKPS